MEEGESICLLEADAATVELPAPASGVLHALAQADEAMEIGATIARITDEASSSLEVGAGPEGGTEPAAPGPADLAAESPTSPGVAGLEGLSPAVRVLVEEHGLDVSQIRGTGRGGRLVKQDVTAYIKERERETRDAQVAQPLPAMTPPAMATPTTFDEIDMGEVLTLCRRHTGRFLARHGVSLSYMPVLSRGCVVALQEFPEVNASLEGGDAASRGVVNLGITVSTDQGTLVPVLRGAEEMTMAAMAGGIERLVGAAREGGLGPDEREGGTFTIADRGALGSLLSTLSPRSPQAAILGAHAIRERPAPVDGEVAIRPMMYVSLSWDPRLVEERTSVAFLGRLRELLEDPTRLMLEM